MLHSLRHLDENDVARYRMKIIAFYERYGEQATKEAFGADRKVVSRWRKRLKEGIQALAPRSTRPLHVRRSRLPEGIITFVKNLRETYPRIGKEKIKPLLDEYCREKGLPSVSESTIGNIIKRYHFFFQRSGRVYHDPASHWARKVRKEKRMRIRRSPKPDHFGHIISDTVERLTDGIKDYFYNAMDVKSRFALTLNYKRLSSRNMEELYDRFQCVYPGEIIVWQSDNGSEHLGDFELRLKRDGITHLFSYPHCPKINAYIERYNRTVQEEFIDQNLDIIHDKKLFAARLADYLVFYNTKRVHKGLKKKTPVDYLIEEGVMSQMCLTYARN